MITLAAVTARETAFISGSGILHGIAPGAIDGFAVGALATGACCLVVAAPRLLHRTRLSARDGMWGTGWRRSKVQRDYFAAPVDVDPAWVEAAPAPVGASTVGASTVGASTVEASTVEASPAITDYAFADSAVTSSGVASMAEARSTATAELFAPEAEVLAFSPTATCEPDEVLADDDPYDAEMIVDPFGDADGSDLILPGTDTASADRDQSGRSGYRSKHRVTNSDATRRPEARRQPRHAAPSAGLATRMSGRLPLVARG
jgi:hypothetical protein